MNDKLKIYHPITSQWTPPLIVMEHNPPEGDPAPKAPERGAPLPPDNPPDPPPYDEVMQSIQELTSTIREHGGNFSTLDMDGLEDSFKQMMADLEEYTKRSLPADRLGLAGQYQSDPVMQRIRSLNPKNKFKDLGIDLVRDGKKRLGRFNVTGADIIVAHHFLASANELKEQGHMKGSMADKIGPVSQDLTEMVKALTGVDSIDKLMGTGVAGGGAELIPTGLNAELWEDFFAESKVVADMNVIPMPTDPFEMPLGLGWPTWRKGTEGLPTASQNVQTQKKTLTSTEQIVDIAWSYDLDELAVIAMMPTVRATISRSGAEAMDAFALNADDTAAATGNINLDDAAPPADAYYLTEGEDGIRHLALVDNTGQVQNAAAAIDDTKMASLISLLGKYALDYQNVRIVPEIQTYFTMLGMTNVATVDKYGMMLATIIKGELGRYRGIPILPSASMYKTEADGKVSVTPANNTLGQIAVYHKNLWSVGFSRSLLIEADRDIRGRQLIMVASFKMAIAAHGTRSSAIHTALSRNITI